MANEKTPVVWDDSTKKHRPLGTGEKMGGLDASSMLSSDAGNLLQSGSDGLAYLSGSGVADPRADNLLEESLQGRLQVTVDRVEEWLDGHPADAKALAGALNVVSGDSGNVISSGSDNGAYLSSAALAAVVAGMSAQQLQTLLAALADGETVVASGGKLIVDPTNAPKAKLQAIAAALRKSGGGLSVDSSTGKLVVDFSAMDPAIMRNVVLSMVQQGGGLAVDPNGQLYVDFDSMPTDKFEALLKSLKMQIPLEANMSVYVATNDSAASDTIEDGRGTEAKPFKTIQACVDWVTQTYALGSYWVYIRVKPGNYVENLSLPDFTHSGGSIEIQAQDVADPPVLKNATNTGTILQVSGGNWRLYRVGVSGSRTANNDGLSHFPSLVAISGTGSLVSSAVEYSEEFTGAAASSGVEHPRMFSLSGGKLTFNAVADYGTSIHAEKGNANYLDVFNVSGGANVAAYASNSASVITDIDCWGTFTTFATVNSSATFSTVGGALYPQKFAVPSGKTAAGKRYDVSKGGGISLTGSQQLPGDTAGTADSSTYGWYVGG